jgi:hypothetical protein
MYNLNYTPTTLGYKVEEKLITAVLEYMVPLMIVLIGL